MPWLRLDDAMGEHRKLRRLAKDSYAGYSLHFAGLLHCARYLTDGMVEDQFVEDFVDDSRMSKRDLAAATKALEGHGLWTKVDGGWHIHDYLDYNPTRADVEAQRERDAARKAKGRRSQAKPSNEGLDDDVSGRTDAGLHPDSAWTPPGLHAESARPMDGGPDPTRPDPYPITCSPAVVQTLVDARGRATEDFPTHIVGILQRGIDGIPTDDGMKPPTRSAVIDAIRAAGADADTALAIAIETRAIAEGQGRAPNIAGLYRQQLLRAVAERATA